MTAPRFATPLAPLSVIRNGLIALQAQCLAAGEMALARGIGAIVDDLGQRLAGSREAA